MFTWNIQFVSRKRLEDTLAQLMVSEGGNRNILVRIHTAIHTAEEAVDLAASVKRMIPNAQILGTSTSAILHEGKLIHDQCLISITQMDGGNVLTARIPLDADGDGGMASAEWLCARAADLVGRDDPKLLFVFSPERYLDLERFVEISNRKMPGVQMIGGVVDRNDVIGKTGFVFDETGWSGQEMILAALGGEKLECFADFATGVQAVGDLHEITKTRDCHILEIDGRPAAAFYDEGVGGGIRNKPEMSFYFPLAYHFDGIDVPFAAGYSGEAGLGANHNVTAGKKIRRGFFYDRKIIADNRSMFNRLESFEKGEALFTYACKDRFRIYPNSVIWELSAYKNSNMSGCLTRGEISTVGGRNVYINCAFVLAAAGENPETQPLNPYVLSHTEILAEDNQKLIGYLTDAAYASARSTDAAMKESIRSFVDSCRQMLLYSEKDNIANEAALQMDMRQDGFDRICLIDVTDQRSMRTVFSEQRIEKTHHHFVSEITSFSAQKKYRAYLLKQWHMAVAVPSYMVSLEAFTEDMRQLQKQMFETKDDYIPIMSVFCIIDETTADTLASVYDAARLEMLQKNIQFYVRNGKEEELDEKSLLERYRMVNVINYALSHDGVVPYYQGIYDNKGKKIHHYEALIRLRDENGKIYSPGEFMDVARSYGLLYDGLSMEMLRKVFETFKNREESSVSINLSMRDIKNRELTRYICSFLSTVRHPENFIFEILENEDVDEYDTLLRFVNNIHKLGGKISIDDFGSGYSNLLHVVSIPADFLKIDGSIIKECSRNRASASLVQLIAAWNKLNERETSIVAEFVESKEIQDKLLQYNIDFSQGYLFSKPFPGMPENENDKYAH